MTNPREKKDPALGSLAYPQGVFNKDENEDLDVTHHPSENTRGKNLKSTSLRKTSLASCP